MAYRVDSPHVLNNEERNPLPLADVADVNAAADDAYRIDYEERYVERFLVPGDVFVVRNVEQEAFEPHRAIVPSGLQRTLKGRRVSHMKTIFWGAFALAALLSASTVNAAVYMEYEGVKGETSAQSSATLQLQAQTSATTSTTSSAAASGSASSSASGAVRAPESEEEAKKKGNVEYGWKVEEGEKAMAPEVEREMKESGEKGGTEDINIGVGEAMGKTNKVDAISIKQSMKGGISVAAGDVNGLTEEEKQQFLARVQEHAEVQSEQDLQNFAKGVLVENAAMEEISLNFDKIKVKYRATGKLFGFIPLSFSQDVEVDTEGDDVGKVKVKMPWFSFLIRADVSPAELESELGMNEKWLKGSASVDAGNNDNWNFGAYASLLAHVSNVLKTRHDTAKNSIGNVR